MRLEAMVGYLAGLDGEDASALRAELADPSSEASRFLEATRLRSRALFEEPTLAIEGPSRAVRHREGPSRAAMAAAVAASVLVSAGVALWLGEARLNRLEMALALREAESRADARRIEAALARAIAAPPKAAAVPTIPNPRPQPIEQALARVEVGLGKLDRRIEGLDRLTPPPAPPPMLTPEPEPAPTGGDPAIAEIRREVAALRRELVASDQAGARQVMEIRMALQDVGNLLRMALSRPPVAVPGSVPNTGLNFQNVQPDGMSPQVLSLMGNLGHTHPQTRLESVEQLGRMGQGAQMALPSLHQLLRQETDARVRAATQSAIGSIAPHR